MSEAHQLPPDDPQDRDYEAEARQLGWHPLNEFRGKIEDWVDAETFISRGEQQLPIMRENNRKLTTRVRQADDANAELRRQMGEMSESLSTMRTMLERGQEVGYQRAKAEFEEQMRVAVRNGDEASFDKIRGDMQRLDAQHDEIKAPVVSRETPKPDAAPKGPKATPEFQNWFDDNKDWVQADQTLGNAAIAAERELRASDDVLSEAELWDRVTEMVQTKYPRRFAAATGSAPPVPESQAPAQPRRAAAVLTPSGGASFSQAKKGGIASIQDPEERKMAQAAFSSIKRGIPDYTEAEYMKVYVNPSADTVGDAISRKAKANGSARAN